MKTINIVDGPGGETLSLALRHKEFSQVDFTMEGAANFSMTVHGLVRTVAWNYDLYDVSGRMAEGTEVCVRRYSLQRRTGQLVLVERAEELPTDPLEVMKQRITEATSVEEVGGL